MIDDQRLLMQECVQCRNGANPQARRLNTDCLIDSCGNSTTFRTRSVCSSVQAKAVVQLHKSDECNASSFNGIAGQSHGNAGQNSTAAGGQTSCRIRSFLTESFYCLLTFLMCPFLYRLGGTFVPDDGKSVPLCLENLNRRMSKYVPAILRCKKGGCQWTCQSI